MTESGVKAFLQRESSGLPIEVDVYVYDYGHDSHNINWTSDEDRK
jgi:hypothetical protein